MFQEMNRNRSSFHNVPFPGVVNIVWAVLIGLALLLGTAGNAAAFSLDVKNLQYTDPDRSINYDFSQVGTDSQPPQPNTIHIPDSFVFPKHASDLSFLIGYLPGMGAMTLVHNADRQAGVLTATDGGAVLTGSSVPPPPLPQNSWIYDVTFRNFTGMTEAGREYAFVVGMSALPGLTIQGPEPRYLGVWNSAGRLELTPQMYDAAIGSATWSGAAIVLEGLTPASTTIRAAYGKQRQ